MEIGPVMASLAISVGLGLLVGLQREWAGSRLAGVRTFPLITLLGTLAGLLGQQYGGGVIVAAGLVAVAAATGVGNYLVLHQEKLRDTGITTEIAVLVMYALGVYAAVGDARVALAVGVVVAVLLQAKGRLHGLAAKIGEKDMRAIMLLAAITFVVLPVLPDRTFGPLDVVNPRQVWLMVVLVVGISLGGYVVSKAVGAQAGVVMGGLLGGLISSTATTVTFSKRARESGAYVGPAMLVIMLASTVVYGRLLVEISVVAPGFLKTAAGPIGVMLGVSAALALGVWLWAARDGEKLPEPENPTELKSALFFAALYAVVLVAVAAGKHYLGDRGVFAVAALSGLTDMDAITLSSARMAEQGGMEARTAWRAIIVAAMSNITFKAGVVLWLGGARLGSRVGVLFAVKILVGVGLVVLWG